MDRKIGYGTRNFLYEPAMTADEYERAISIGADLVDECYNEGCNVICFGEMGIGNTSPSSIWMHLLADIPLAQCIGAGSGLNSEGMRHKYDVLSRAVEKFKTQELKNPETKELKNSETQKLKNSNTQELTNSQTQKLKNLNILELKNLQTYKLKNLLTYFGGYEMVAALGGMMRAADHRMIILVDGFIMSACMLAASKLRPEILEFAIFGHCGDESGHRLMLNAMNAEPLLSLGLRLGEGTGAICAYPILQSAVNMINEMDNFDHAEITKYF
jgi:nicotinate-nucleotide--dimethylbenzimidazole phosphoribosyltransferase